MEQLVDQAQEWGGWPKARILSGLGVSRSRYYRRRRSTSPAPRRCAARPRQPHALLDEEREAVIAHAVGNPNLRHRELAWDMVDKDVAFVSPSTVYRVLSEHGLTHVRIRPHCPEENGLVERAHRTFAEVIDEMEFRDVEDARAQIAEIARWYNEERLHSALYFLRPVDYYRGKPAPLLEERRRKLAEARHRRKERNLEIRQQTMAFDATRTRQDTH